MDTFFRATKISQSTKVNCDIGVRQLAAGRYCRNGYFLSGNENIATHQSELRYSLEPSPVVRETGLEPVRLATHAPQTCLSASSSTLAYSTYAVYSHVEYYNTRRGKVNRFFHCGTATLSSSPSCKIYHCSTSRYTLISLAPWMPLMEADVTSVLVRK